MILILLEWIILSVIPSINEIKESVLNNFYNKIYFKTTMWMS